MALDRPVTQPRRVLVTGATGFIGRHCLTPLLERGFVVHAVGRSPLAAASAVWHAADLLDVRDRQRLIDQIMPTHLLHAAWYVEPGLYLESPLNIDWVVASLDLLRRFQAAGGSRAVGIGSCFEYAFGEPNLSESSPLGPSTVYGACKQVVGVAGGALSRATDLSFAWARPFFLYGPYEDRRRLVPDVVTALLDGREVATSNGTQRRDYMYVADAGDALAALLDSHVEGPVNVATGEAPPVRDLLTAFGDRIGRPELIRFGARSLPPGDPSEIRADVTRLREEVGWSQVSPLGETVDRTIAWWRAALPVAR